MKKISKKYSMIWGMVEMETLRNEMKNGNVEYVKSSLTPTQIAKLMKSVKETCVYQVAGNADYLFTLGANECAFRCKDVMKLVA